MWRVFVTVAGGVISAVGNVQYCEECRVHLRVFITVAGEVGRGSCRVLGEV